MKFYANLGAEALLLKQLNDLIKKDYGITTDLVSREDQTYFFRTETPEEKRALDNLCHDYHLAYETQSLSIRDGWKSFAAMNYQVLKNNLKLQDAFISPTENREFSLPPLKSSTRR